MIKLKIITSSAKPSGAALLSPSAGFGLAASQTITKNEPITAKNQRSPALSPSWSINASILLGMCPPKSA